MAIRDLFYGMLMLAIGALFTWGLSGALEQRAILHNEAVAEAPVSKVQTPNIADGADKSSNSRWMF
jgi:hypothetical protein